MKSLILLLIGTLEFSNASNSNVSRSNSEEEAAKYLQNLNSQLNKQFNLNAEADWAYDSNITDANERNKNKVSAESAKFQKEIAENLKKFDSENFRDPDLKRQFKKLGQLGYAVLSEKDYDELMSSLSKMDGNYAKVKVCNYTARSNCALQLDPELTEIFTKSRDPEELAYYWKEWYDKAGTPTRNSFEKYVELNTKSAKLNNFTSGAEVWLDEYEDETVEQQLEDIYSEIRPLYEQIHGYVRWRLRQFYGNKVVSKTGPIPMHLLGNMWAQTWDQIASIISPFPNKPQIDVTNEMVRQGYNPKKMFQLADEFYQSLNLKKLPETFWNKSIIQKPTDGRDLICHASSWNFFSNDDFRIKQCTRVTQEDLATVHHEQGHIQYFMQYQNLPNVYRTGANPGFHEAVGDVLALSFSTPKHLEKIGLLKNYKEDEEARLNKLFLTALDKIVFLPFALTMDKYRWALFRGEVKSTNWNCAFWKLREEYSGIEPPIVRTEKDFDAPAKFHVTADVEYLRYFVSFVIQFQFYKSACIKAGQYEPNNPELPLDNCDFYGSAEAGKAFEAMLSMGSSKPWPDAMEAFTGERKMSGKAIAEYFEPLRVWLEAENIKNNVHIGWSNSDKCRSKVMDKFNGQSSVKLSAK